MTGLKKKLIRFYNRHSRSIIITTVVVLSGWFVMNGLMQLPTINENRLRTAEVNAKIEEEKNRQAEIDDLTTKVNTDEYIEKMAQDKLGLVKSNATIFYDISEEN